MRPVVLKCVVKWTSKDILPYYVRFHSEGNIMFSSKGIDIGNKGTSIHHFTGSREEI